MSTYASNTLTKIIIANQEFLVLDNPLKGLRKIFGANFFLIKLLTQRFEMYSSCIIAPYQINDLFLQISHFIPMRIGIEALYTYNLIFLEYANSYRTYRHLFNLPVNGQRTWGGGRSIKILKSQLYNFKLKRLTKFFGCSQSTFMAEMVNLL